MYESAALSAGKPLRFGPGNRLPHPKINAFRCNNVRYPAGAASSFRASVKTFPSEPAAAESAIIRPPGTLYEVLRVNKTASFREIKTAYWSLAKMYHPDASSLGSDGRDFIEIHNAYATLSDPTARAIYDLTLGVQRRRVMSGAVGRPARFYPTRRWETDQCW